MDIDRGTRLTEFAPLLWYQEKMLSETLKSYSYAQQEIWSTLVGINFQFNPEKGILENCRSGGSLGYNALVKKMQNVEISQSLQNHGVVEKYAWVWLLDNDSIIDLSMIWFDSMDKCEGDAEIRKPSFDICGNSQGLILHIMSTCRCVTAPPGANKLYNVCNKCMTRWSPQFKVISKTLPELFERWSMWDRYSEIENVKNGRTGRVLQYVCDCGHCEDDDGARN